MPEYASQIKVQDPALHAKVGTEQLQFAEPPRPVAHKGYPSASKGLCLIGKAPEFIGAFDVIRHLVVNAAGMAYVILLPCFQYENDVPFSGAAVLHSQVPFY